MSYKLPLLLFVMLSVASHAAGQDTVEMADLMRSNGKIYVVVGVVAIVLIGLLLYLVTIDRKVTRMEKHLKNKKDQ